ncbi:MAG TPA: condensation domain-containing protein, partial [Candidatus Dormibacteraeota bacterium]|nr:condensation domain-containing protein [Candidatus Dormibacteraeota bacterium]
LTFFAGTFCKHPLAMAAADAVLGELERRGPALQESLSRRTAELVAELRAAFAVVRCPIDVHHFASQFVFQAGAADSIGELFFKGLVHRGVYVWEGRTSFLSTAHSAEDLEAVVAAARDTARELVDGRVLVPGLPSAGPAPAAWFPCRDEQQLLWLGMEMDPGAAAVYNEVLTIPLRGRVDEAVVAEAVRALVGRHDALRLRLDAQGRRQSVVDDPACPLELVGAGEGDARWERARAAVAALRAGPFDLERGPLVRAALLRLRDGEHVVALAAPHLAVDGWSLTVLRREFELAYRALAAGEAPAWDPPARFEEFVRWEVRGQAAGGDRALAHWRRRLDGLDPRPMLPGSPASARSYAARRLRRELPRETRAGLRSACSALAATPFMIGLAAWFGALRLTTGRPDLVVAITVAGQPLAGGHDLVGYCLKVLPIRVAVDPADSFATVVGRVSTGISEARDNWFVPESAVIEAAWAARDRARAPLGGVSFELERPEPAVTLEAAAPIDVDLVGRPFTKWDASMILADEGEVLAAELVHTAPALAADEAAALLQVYAEILRAGCADPTACLRPAAAPGPRLARRKPVRLESPDR